MTAHVFPRSSAGAPCEQGRGEPALHAMSARPEQSQALGAEVPSLPSRGGLRCVIRQLVSRRVRPACSMNVWVSGLAQDHFDECNGLRRYEPW
jgi:hypothetical protein